MIPKPEPSKYQKLVDDFSPESPLRPPSPGHTSGPLHHKLPPLPGPPLDPKEYDFFYIWISVILLAASCLIMQVAWYLHLKYQNWTYLQAIFFSWFVAFFEYMLQVPANKLAHRSGMESASLRAIAEIFILTAFIGFNKMVLKQNIVWNHLIGFGLVGVGVIMVLMGPFTDSIHLFEDDNLQGIQASENSMLMNSTALSSESDEDFGNFR